MQNTLPNSILWVGLKSKLKTSLYQQGWVRNTCLSIWNTDTAESLLSHYWVATKSLLSYYWVTTESLLSESILIHYWAESILIHYWAESLLGKPPTTTVTKLPKLQIFFLSDICVCSLYVHVHNIDHEIDFLQLFQNMTYMYWQIFSTQIYHAHHRPISAQNCQNYRHNRL